MAATALLVVFLDLVPERINALGLELGEEDQRGILWALLIFTVAFLGLFVLYAASDLSRALARLKQLDSEIAEYEQQQPPRRQRILELLQAAPGRSGEQEQLQELVAGIEGQVVALAGAVSRHRELGLARSAGLLRLFAEFGLPLLLGAAAALALAFRIA